MTKEETFKSSPSLKESVLASSPEDVQNTLVTATNVNKNDNQHYNQDRVMQFMETISTHCSELDTLNEATCMTDRNENKTLDSTNRQGLQFAECRYVGDNVENKNGHVGDYYLNNRVYSRDEVVNAQLNINTQLLKKIRLGDNAGFKGPSDGKFAKLTSNTTKGSNAKHNLGNVSQVKAGSGNGYNKAQAGLSKPRGGSDKQYKTKIMQDLEYFKNVCLGETVVTHKLAFNDSRLFQKSPFDPHSSHKLHNSSQGTKANDNSKNHKHSPRDQTFARLRNVYYWFRPFTVAQNKRPTTYLGLPLVESLSGNVQKSWHLEAIKSLDRALYSSLKMVMLRLSNDKTNIHPKRLLIRCKGSWETIQEGSFGTVYVGSVQGKGYSAVKIPNLVMLNHDPVGVMRRFINEWDILSRCNHPNIVSLHGGIILGVFDIWLCTELVHGVDLHSIKYGNTLSRTIPVPAAIKMCRQLADVLVYLHTSRPEKDVVIHRDIKPENIIVDPDWNIKLCDFGDASETSDGSVGTVSGATWLYAPPELLLHPTIKNDLVGLHGTPSFIYNCVEYPPNVLSEKWDVWSAGCVFQEMFGYVGPFHHLVEVDDSPNTVCEKMVKSAIYGLVPNVPKVFANTKLGNLIAQCLDLNPKNRPSAQTIQKVLHSPDLLEVN